MRRGVVIGGKGARSSERTALRGTDPVGVGVRELEGHDAPVPATCRGLSDALSERSGIHEAVGCVGDATGLANNELVEVDAVVRNLKQRGAREGRTRGVDEARTVRVETLVVELDVVLYMGSIPRLAMNTRAWGREETHEVDQGPDVLVDRQVRTSSKLGVRREPRGERRMGEDELALGKGLAEGGGEGCHPLLRCAVATVHGVEVLVVDINTIKLVVEHKLGERVRGADGIRALRRGLVRLTEGGHDDVDAGVVVLGLLRSAHIGGECSVRTRLVECPLEG